MNLDNPYKSNKKTINIDLVPLINVIFLLLIFFMLTGSIEKLDIVDVDLPETSSGKENFSEPAILYITKNQQLAVNDDLVSENDLPTILSTLAINNPNQEIAIKMDKSIKAAKLIKTMQLIEKLQIKNITLMVSRN